MQTPKEVYKERALNILTNFQLMEFALKIYIGKSYEFIQFLVGEKVHFDFSINDVKNYPLERLLGLFGKLNDNKELKKRLDKLRSQRNDLAHDALLFTIGDVFDMDLIHKKLGDFFHLENEIAECLQLLTKEGRLLLVKFSQGNSINHPKE